MEHILNRPNFLASEVGLRTVTFTFDKANAQAVTENGVKILKAGTIYPANDGTAVGIVFEDVKLQDVNGVAKDGVGALMVAGHYLKDKLVGSVATATETAFKGKGLFGETSPAVNVPADGTISE